MQDSIFTMPTLPTELIVEILSRLSVKSLLKFKCVSKSWRSLISSPHFVKTHLSVSAKNPRLLLTELRNLFCLCVPQEVLKDCSVSSLRNDSVTEAFEFDYPMNNPKVSVSVVGSINGLICLAIGETELVLWNPSVRLYRKLPDSGLKLSNGSSINRATSVSINRATSVIHGFGYDESSNDYKVVGVLCRPNYGFFHPPKVKICSLRSNFWRSKDDILDGVQLIEPCKFLNGKLHWVRQLNWTYGTRGFGYLHDWDIICIDLADKEWEKVEQPCYGGGEFSLTLEVLGSDLSVFCNHMTSHADVWVMTEYGVKESWAKRYTIKYPAYQWSPFIYQTLCMSNKGDILLVPGSTLMVHNPEDEPIRYPKVTNFGFCIAMNIYIESLLCGPLY